MNNKTKQRLVGAITLIALVVVVVPLMLGSHDNNREEANLAFQVPPPPPMPVIEHLEPVKQQAPQLAVAQKEPQAAVVAANKTPAPVRIAKATSSIEPTAKIAVKPQQLAAKKKPLLAKAPTKAISPATAWVVQLASFTKSDNAKAFERDLRAKGFPAYIRRLHTNGNDTIRVFVGPEVKRDNAQLLLTRLEKETHNKGFIVAYRPVNT